MAQITTSNGRPVVDYMARDFQSFLQTMRDLVPRKLPEWRDFQSEADFGHVLLQLFAHMGDILSYYQDRVANESFLGTAQSRRSIIHHLRLIGYRLATAAPASTNIELSFPANRTGVVSVRPGDAFATKSQKDRPSVRFEYNGQEPLAFDLSAGSPDFRLEDGRKLVAGVPVEEGRTIRNETLGISDGSANQRFALAQPRLILKSLGQGQDARRDVLLTTDKSVEPWALRETLAFSRRGLQDFVIEIDEDDRATVDFGDGVFGAIPAKLATITASYRVGGGTLGNIPTGAIDTIVDASELALAGAQVTNRKAATGGAEVEAIEQAVGHAPNVFRSSGYPLAAIKRAVTAADYEALALKHGGVGKVRAEAPNWNTVTLYVAPQGATHGRRQVSDVLEANLLDYFEDKRPLSTIVEIRDVTYVEIYVSARVWVKSYYPRDQVAEQVRREAGGLLAFEKVRFGEPIFLSRFYEAIEAIEGVDHVFISQFRKAAAVSEGSEIEIPPDGIESDGQIPLAKEELPTAPTAADYADGIRVVIEKGGF